MRLSTERSLAGVDLWDVRVESDGALKRVIVAVGPGVRLPRLGADRLASIRSAGEIGVIAADGGPTPLTHDAQNVEELNGDVDEEEFQFGWSD